MCNLQNNLSINLLIDIVTITLQNQLSNFSVLLNMCLNHDNIKTKYILKK